MAKKKVKQPVRLQEAQVLHKYDVNFRGMRPEFAESHVLFDEDTNISKLFSRE